MSLCLMFGCKKCVKFEDSNRAIPRNLQAVSLYWLHTILKILSDTWKFVTFYDEKVKQNFKPRTFSLHTNVLSYASMLESWWSRNSNFLLFFRQSQNITGSLMAKWIFQIGSDGQKYASQILFWNLQICYFQALQSVFVKCLLCVLYWTTCKSPSPPC